MPESHAKLSPSAAERWMTCPGSVVLSFGMSSQSSPYADEGTLAHTIGEALLTGKPIHSSITKEMLDHVQVYVDHVRGLMTPDCTPHVEKRVQVTPNVWGTADAIVWDPSDATLYVRDLKYGAGVGVEVSDNLQLKIYALAALITMGYPARTVNVGICQPRYPHVDGANRSKDFDAIDLIDFHADIMDAVEQVERAWGHYGKDEHWTESFLIPSEKGCRWCLGAPKCDKVKAKAKEMVANKVFAPELPYDAKELAEILNFLPVLDSWAKNVREFAYGEAEKGNPIPSYKLVPKVPVRKWKPGIEAELAFALGVPKAELFGEAPMKGVTELQKMAPGKNDKERAAVLDPFTTKESSGHTLVHESDKREAVRIDAKQAFA